ncbi:efflux RND transporter periplasmic adaptor subunit [uncultured Paracoccus sp.]|uniref:efflux RND transporter periplasmic adaptor subunit n=1 Tax=uncultured Paracoccus sp. TaxID=189685 RepID=UPI00263A02F2|nr:efflux RND transporter periplasmic adaptor subunit [uncultured Paracoccus sp.]
MNKLSCLLGFAVAFMMLAGCREDGSASAMEAAEEMPPSEVGVVISTREAIPVLSELPGRISPVRISEVRPRVGGIIVERVFEQGTFVKEGDPLFRIDPVMFEVEVEAAQAGIARAEAQLLRARQEAERARVLVSRNATSQASFENAVANERQAEADLASARATLRAAEINLAYATVTAPITGQIGRAMVTEGALVSSSGGEPLATIQQIDPVYADIQQPVSEMMRLRAALRDGSLEEIEPGVGQVHLMLDDGSQYPHAGRLLFSEATVERSSGQVTLRAEFPNPDGTLLSGLYVRVRVEQGVDGNAIAIPNQAVRRDGSGNASLWIVGEDNIVVDRPVTLGRVESGRTIIASGLEEGESVILDGFQKTGPGAPVEPVPWVDALTERQQSPSTADADETTASGR